MTFVKYVSLETQQLVQRGVNLDNDHYTPHSPPLTADG